MYCHNNGRPSIDPAVLIKFLLIGSLYGSNSERRISEEIIVFLCAEKGLTDGKLVFTDSTHIKADASRKTEYIRQTEKVTNEYLKELNQHEETVRSQLESEGKIKPVRCRKRKEKIQTVNCHVSSTDPESGFYKRKWKAKGMH